MSEPLKNNYGFAVDKLSAGLELPFPLIVYTAM